MTGDEDEDVRRLFERAIGAEPPLALDRDEILRRGRRRVRLRRFAASGGVAASVVAVVVGTAVLTGIAGGRGGDSGDRAPAYGSGFEPPASTTSGASAPAGPRLPLTPSASDAVPPTSDQHAETLTVVLAKSGVIPQNVRPRSPMVFSHDGGSYYTTVDLIAAHGAGQLTIQVSHASPGAQASCVAGRPLRQVSCTVTTRSGVPTAAGVYSDEPAGLTQYDVHTMRPDGTVVWITATNKAPDTPVARGKPPLDLEVLQLIAGLPLTYA